MNGEIHSGMYFDPEDGAKVHMMKSSHEGKPAWCAMYYFGLNPNGGPIYPPMSASYLCSSAGVFPRRRDDDGGFGGCST